MADSTPAVGNYDGANSQGGTGGPMGPPTLPPVIIPANTNPIPTAITSPMSASVTSPTSAGGFVRRAAPEPNKRALYVGGLDPRVTDDILKQIFETTGHVVSVKIIPDKNVSDPILPIPISGNQSIIVFGNYSEASVACWSVGITLGSFQ